MKPLLRTANAPYMECPTLTLDAPESGYVVRHAAQAEIAAENVLKILKRYFPDSLLWDFKADLFYSWPIGFIHGPSAHRQCFNRLRELVFTELG